MKVNGDLRIETRKWRSPFTNFPLLVSGKLTVWGQVSEHSGWWRQSSQ